MDVPPKNWGSKTRSGAPGPASAVFLSETSVSPGTLSFEDLNPGHGHRITGHSVLIVMQCHVVIVYFI